MQLILLGPPGVGKGTQAEKLREVLSLVSISTGDMLRIAVRDETPLGKTAKSFMDSGTLVPDEVMIGLIQERLAKKDAQKGFILDGFPRTVEQAKALEKVLGEAKMKIDHVLRITADDEIVVRRISGRRTCKKCGAPFHVDFQSPKKSDVCDHCGGALEQRGDDREETVGKRLKVYREKTQPVVTYYAQKGLLREISGENDISTVFQHILAAIGVTAATAVPSTVRHG